MNLENTILRGESHGIEDKRIRRKVKEALRDLNPDEYPNCVNEFLTTISLTRETREAILKAEIRWKEEREREEAEEQWREAQEWPEKKAERMREEAEEQWRKEWLKEEAGIREEEERERKEAEEQWRETQEWLEEEAERRRKEVEEQWREEWLKEEAKIREKEEREREEAEEQWREAQEWPEEEAERRELERIGIVLTPEVLEEIAAQVAAKQCIKKFPRHISSEEYDVLSAHIKWVLEKFSDKQGLNDVIQQKYAEILRYRHVAIANTTLEDRSLFILRDLITHTGIKPPDSLVQQALRELIERQLLEAFQDLINITGIEPSGNYALDTSVLVDLMISQEAGDFFEKAFSRFKGNKFSTSYSCLDEAKKVLRRDYNYSNQQACAAIEYLIDNFGITVVPRGYERYITDSEIDYSGNQFGLNKEDRAVIQYFAGREDTVIIVRDRRFINTCDHLCIDRIDWPKFYNRRPR